MGPSKLGKWLKRQFIGIVLATGKVGENALNQEGTSLGEETKMQQSIKQGTLSHDLINGQLTQQVMELRWRTYKVLEATQSIGTKFLGYMKDDDGNDVVIEGEKVPLFETFEINPTSINATGDPFDDYDVELIVDNTTITRGRMGDGSIDDVQVAYQTQNELEEVKEKIKEGDEDTGYKIMYDPDGNEVVVPANVTSARDFHEAEEKKDEHPVLIWREYRTKFELEKFTKKLYIRNIDDKNKLLEFYVAKYPDEDNKKSQLFISEIKKAIKNPRVCDFTDINEVGFITDKTIGAKDFREYQYKVLGVDKIVEHDGYYIIKFKAEVMVDGEYIMEKYRMDDLDEKYENKERKDNEAGNTYSKGFENEEG